MVDGTREINPQIQVLNSILENKNLQQDDIPLLVLINKSDLKEFTDFDLLRSYLNFERLNKKYYNFMTICAVDGKGVKESLNWIYYSMCNIAFEETKNVIVGLESEAESVLVKKADPIMNSV